jgi:hypothetical protein
MDALVEDYKKDGLATPNGRLIITGTRAEAGILNKKVQAARKEEGHLGTQSAVVEQQKIHVNDRVMITKRSPIHRVENGDVGTVIAIDNTRGVMTVDVEGEKSRRVHIPYRTFTDVRLGYAVESKRRNPHLHRRERTQGYGCRAGSEDGPIPAEGSGRRGAGAASGASPGT